MSNTAMTLFNTPKLQVPSHAASFFAEESNIENRVTVPTLSYEGKVWTISVNGEKTKLMKTNSDGDEEPLSVMRVVVVDYAKRRGRTYYEGDYDPAKPGAPLCWSEDGVTPHTAVKEPKASACQSCPMAIKGSKITAQGKPVTACSQHRMIAVVPANKLDFQPLRMKLAITSDWDKNSPELEAQGWFAFNNYTEMLRSKGIQHTAAVVTKMRFDPNTAYPKVMFSPDRWLEDAELVQVAPTVKSDAVKALLTGTWTPAGADGVKIEGTKPQVSLLTNDDDDEQPAPPVTKPVKKANPAPVVMDMDDDDDDAVVIEAPVKVKPSEQVKAAAPSGDLPDEVQAVLDEWGDD